VVQRQWKCGYWIEAQGSRHDAHAVTTALFGPEIYHSFTRSRMSRRAFTFLGVTLGYLIKVKKTGTGDA